MNQFMRNLYLVFLPLAFSSFGARTLAQVSEKTNQTQAPDRQLAQQFLQSSQEVVEKDGLFFQTVVSQPNFLIPRRNRNTDRLDISMPIKADSSIPIDIGVRIRNNTNRMVRLTGRYMSNPIFVRENGQKIQPGSECTLITAPKESEYPWVRPGESVTFFVRATIFWYEDELTMNARDIFGCYWDFGDLKPGKYKLQFRYRGTTEEADVYKPERKVISGMWMGEVVTPPVEFSLTID
jgi:hypothetical protein